MPSRSPPSGSSFVLVLRLARVTPARRCGCQPPARPHSRPHSLTQPFVAASQLLVSSGAAYAVRRIFGRGLKAEPRGGQRRAPVELERAIAPWQCAALEKVLKGQRVRVRTTRADASYAEKEHIPHVHVYLQVSARASDPTRRDTRGLLLLLLCPSELTRHVHRSTWSWEPSGGRTIRTSASTRCGDLGAISRRDLLARSRAHLGRISGASRAHLRRISGAGDRGEGAATT